MNKRLIKSNDEGGGGASFNTVLYTGNDTGQSIAGVGFQPDFTWIKNRTTTGYWHVLTDSVRGTNSQLFSNEANAQDTKTIMITSFDSDGFSVGSDDSVNGVSSQNYVSWNWKAGGAAVTNTDGTITSQVSANVEAGFSIVSYTGTDVNNTIGHGLGIAPNVIIFKDRTIGRNWRVYHSAIGAGQNLKLNTTDAASSDAAIFQSTTPTENVFYVGASGDVNANTDKFIAYCFAEVAGFSKFGSYVGNGGTQSINVGFEPAFVLLKSSSNASNWYIFDNKRGAGYRLFPDLSNAEDFSGNQLTSFNTDGFSLGDSGNTNLSGGTFIYMAFANQF